MDNKTVQYKRTLRGSVGAGVSALFNGNGRRYYILEHKDASKYHKAGESQKIIIDQVELGRDGNCQVRFDETFQTVSRRHAAIIKDGDRWKLVQLSKTNSTFLNGRPVENEWYLENGDEIQLSVGGPRMGFIVPAGKQSLVSSIKMTERLELFRKQALRPYKAAIACLACVLVLAVAGLTTWNIMEHNYWVEKQEEAKAELAKLDSINQSQLAVIEKNVYAHDSLIAANNELSDKLRKKYYNLTGEIKKIQQDQNGDWRSLCDPYVFYIQTTRIILTMLDGTQQELPVKKYGWSGSGFLLNDGRFVTAKHCIVGWQFNPGFARDEEGEWSYTDAGGHLNYLVNNKAKDITIYFTAFSSGKSKFEFTNKNCIYSERNDEMGTLPDTDIRVHLSPIDYTDWAYIQTNVKGEGLKCNSAWSLSPKSGTKLNILGYPNGYVSEDTKALTGSCKVAHDGLDNNRITVTERNFEQGNSGGPVFYMNGNSPEVIGLVSAGRGETIGFIVPIGVVK